MAVNRKVPRSMIKENDAHYFLGIANYDNIYSRNARNKHENAKAFMVKGNTCESNLDSTKIKCQTTRKQRNNSES